MKSTCAIAHEFPEAFLAFGLHNSSLGSGALFAAHRASLAFLDNVAGFIELRPEILRAPRLGHGRDGGRYSGSRSEEHTSELQSLMRISYAVFCLKKKTYHPFKVNTMPCNN